MKFICSEKCYNSNFRMHGCIEKDMGYGIWYMDNLFPRTTFALVGSLIKQIIQPKLKLKKHSILDKKRSKQRDKLMIIWQCMNFKTFNNFLQKRIPKSILIDPYLRKTT